jgi:hypothetical protein
MLRISERRAGYRLALSLFLLFTLPWLAASAHAAEDCAGTSQALIQFLNKSETQSTPYKIKVLSGTYVMTGAKYSWQPTASLTIEGGYADCNTRGPNTAAATVIDSSALFPGFQLTVSSGDLKLDGVTFLGGATTAFMAGDLSPGNLVLTHVRLTQTQAVVMVTDGNMSVDNALIDHAPADIIDHCSARLVMTGDNAVKWKFVTMETDPNDNFCIDINGDDAHHNSAEFYDTIVWPGNIRTDVPHWHQGDAFDVKLINSVFKQVIATQGTVSESESLHVDPLWINPVQGNFALQVPPNPISPAINKGAGAAQCLEEFPQPM